MECVGRREYKRFVHKSEVEIIEEKTAQEADRIFRIKDGKIIEKRTSLEGCEYFL